MRSKIDNTIRESSKLREDFNRAVALIQDNEAIYQGFKLVQYALLLSDSLPEVSERPLKYCEDIFEIDRAVLFMKRGHYSLTNDIEKVDDRIFIVDDDAFKYTFLEKRPYFGNGKSLTVLHETFRVYDNNDNYSFTIVPVQDGNTIAGAIGFFSNDVERYTQDSDYTFLSELAVIMSIALHNLNSSFMLKTMVQTDCLTCLPNKSMLEVTASEWIKNFHENEQEFAFMVLDIDKFKLVNDTLGHVTGDEVLVRVSNILLKNIDKSDVLGRFGGDEFYLFTEDTDYKSLQAMISSVNKEIDMIKKEFGLPDIVGVSAGVIILDVDKNKNDTFGVIFQTADELLYKAKQNGGKGIA